MSHADETENVATFFIKPGRVGVSMAPSGKDVSFAPCDCVYINAGPDQVPHLAKIMDVSEDDQVRVRWFFRPCDIPSALNLLNEPLQAKEVFLALGNGREAEDTCVLDAIVGKCNLICSAKHELNPEPSEEDVNKAEYVFFRCFDVESSTISLDLSKAVEEFGAWKVFNRIPSTNLALEAELHGSSFSELFWDQSKLEKFYESELVMELENFDINITTSDIQEAFQTIFPNVQCQIQVTPPAQLPVHLDYMRTGHALVFFKSKEHAEDVLRELEENCLVLTPDERPVVARMVEPPKEEQTFFGHIKECEPHFATPNTLEFQRALSWRVFDERCKLQWELLHEAQEQELKDLLN